MKAIINTLAKKDHENIKIKIFMFSKVWYNKNLSMRFL